MALIPCPECQRQISDKASFCPQCGYPMNPAPRTTTPRPVPGARPVTPAPTPPPRPVYQQPQTYPEAPPRVVHDLTDEEMAELCPGMVSTSVKKAKKKSIFKRWWFWAVVVAVVVAAVIGVFLANGEFSLSSIIPPSSETEAGGTVTPESTTSGGIDTDEHLLTVEITLPGSMFENEDMTTFDPEIYAEENNFLSAKINEDGSVTIKMTRSRHNELLKEMSDSLDASFAELIEGEDTPYIKEITHNDDFSVVTIRVDRAAYENSWDFTPLTVSISAMFYQAFLDMDYHVEIIILDVDTGDVINTSVYPGETE
ncbi:MAG: zinc ribbon domain-containing protein [Oscillospiraceae bacterium]|nr:zinc ribbon domain-containing protein [Oscillospiraceae bacterium]